MVSLLTTTCEEHVAYEDIKRCSLAVVLLGVTTASVLVFFTDVL